MKRKLLLLIAIIIALTACSDSPTSPRAVDTDEGPYTIQGKVMDEHGEGIPEVEVELKEEVDDIRKTVTNNSGEYEFPNTDAGTYHLIVNIPEGLRAESSDSLMIRIPDDGVVYNFTLLKIQEVILEAEPGEEVSKILESGVRANLRNESTNTIRIEIAELREDDSRTVPGANYPIQIRNLNNSNVSEELDRTKSVGNGGILKLQFPYSDEFNEIEPVLRSAVDPYEFAFPLKFELSDLSDFDKESLGLQYTGALFLIIDLPHIETIPSDDPLVIALEGMDTTCGSEVYDLKGPLNHGEVGDRIPVILVHGWQSTRRTCKSFIGDNIIGSEFDPVESLKFYRKIINDDPLLDRDFAIFTYRYPTFVPIKEAAEVLASMIDNAEWDQLAILGHSRGGLVGRVTSSIIADASKVTLITLGTPHEGALIAEDTQKVVNRLGSLSLERCGHLPRFTKRQYLNNWLTFQIFRRTILDAKGASHMTRDAVSKLPKPGPNINTHLIGSFIRFGQDWTDDEFTSYNYCLGYLWYEDQDLFSDGIVETVSTIPNDWQEETHLFDELDHGHLRVGKPGKDDKLKDAIREALFSIDMNAIPTVVTSSITSVTTNSAQSGGDVTDDGGASVTARGVCWSTFENPSTSDDCTTDGSGSGSFTSDITGLSPDTKYYVRAYASNDFGTVYGQQRDFKTLDVDLADFPLDKYSNNEIPIILEIGTGIDTGSDEPELRTTVLLSLQNIEIDEPGGIFEDIPGGISVKVNSETVITKLQITCIDYTCQGSTEVFLEDPIPYGESVNLELNFDGSTYLHSLTIPYEIELNIPDSFLKGEKSKLTWVIESNPTLFFIHFFYDIFIEDDITASNFSPVLSGEQRSYVVEQEIVAETISGDRWFVVLYASNYKFWHEDGVLFQSLTADGYVNE